MILLKGTRSKGALKALCFLVAFLACGSFPSMASSLNQNAANEAAARTQRRGSDNSMEASNNSAMRAVMNLASLNIPGAFSNGYRAYGEYINSEKLDDLEARNLREQSKYTTLGARKNVASSPGASAPGSPGGTSSVRPNAPTNTAPNAGGTTFSRLDPSFLYRGESAEIAAEFEKKSGMKRETFLKHLASATDSDITWDDPHLMAKLEARFQAFVADVPNPEFRAGLERAANLFPGKARVEVLQKLAGFYQDAYKAWNKDEPKTSVADNMAGNGEVPTSSEIRSPASQGLSSPPVSLGSSDPVPTDVVAKSNPARGASLYIGLRGDAQATLQDYLATDLREDTIFKIINKKYRQLTPGLLGSLSRPAQ